MLNLRLSTDSLIHKKTRKTTTKSIVSVTVAITVATLIAVLVAIALGYDPKTLIVSLFTKAFLDYKTLIYNIVILGIGALAFSFAFKVGTFNIGIPGQMMTAGMTVLAISIALKGHYFPQGSGQIFMLLIAFSSAALIGAISSLLNVYLKVNIVVTSILINWIVFFLVRYLVQTYYPNPDSTGIIANSVAIPDQFLLVAPGIGGWLPSLILLLSLAIGIWILLKYTVFGKKIIAVGKSFTGSQYAGYNTRLLTILTMTISSGLSGILGYVLYTSGSSPNIPASTTSDALPNEGFNGIAIGLIGMSNPLAILPVSFIIGLFQTSSPFLNTPGSFSGLIIGLVMLGATLFVVVLWFKPWIWLKEMIWGYNGPKDYERYENRMDSLISKYWSESFEIKQYYKFKRKNRYLLFKTLLHDQNLYQKILHQSYQQAMNELDAKYRLEKKRVIAQYKKHNLLSTASRYFTPELNKQKKLEHNLHEYDMFYLKVIDFTKQKIFKLEDKINYLKSRNQNQKYDNKIVDLTAKLEKLQEKVRNENYKHEQNREILEQKIITKQAKKVINSQKVEQVYNHSLVKAQKLNLESEEKTLLIQWINESYQTALLQKEGKIK